MTPAVVEGFFDAIRDRDLEGLRAIASENPDIVRAHQPASKGCCGATVMNAAVAHGDTELLAALLELGADPDQPSDWPPGPFRALDSIPDPHLDTIGPWLVEHGATLTPYSAAKLGRLDDLERLLGADPEALHRKGPDGQTPLHVARTPEIAAFLLDRGADIEATCVDHGSTPAEYAATSRPDVCRLLLDRGARGDEFMYALIGDRDRLLAAIEADPGTLHARMTPDRFTPTEEEAAHIYMYTVGSNCTLLHAAVTKGHGDLVRELIGLGADPNARGGYDDQTPAHAAAWANDPEMIRVLAACGANVDLPSGRIHKNPPAGWGIVNGCVEAVEALFGAGAEVRPYYRRDAEAGAEGEFRWFTTAPPERYRALAELIDRTVEARNG